MDTLASAVSRRSHEKLTENGLVGGCGRMVGKQEVIRFLPVDVITRPASRRPCCGVTLTARAAAREQTFRVVSTAWDVHEFLWHTCLPQSFLAVYNRTPKMARHTGGEEIMHRKTYSWVLGRTQPSLSSKIHPSV